MYKITTWVLFMLLGTISFAQSFTNIDELLQLSELDPLECEKTLDGKGFTFVKTDGLKSNYSNFPEAVQYGISPRSIHYKTLNRIFFLEVNSKLIKQGFVLANSEGVLTNEEDGTSETIKAQQYEKGKFTVWLYIEKEGDKTDYHIQVDNSAPSSVKKSSGSGKTRGEFKYKGDKENINYGYFMVGLVMPRGIIKEAPKSNTSFNEDLGGLSGIGAKAGFECAVGGVLGITPLNQKLPHPLDFGIMLNGQYSVQPYSYESIPAYEDYVYTGFMKVGAGVGPTMTLTPFREADFHLTFYYKLEAAGNFEGSFKYIGSESYEESMERDAMSFAWVKTYGLHIYGGGFFGGVEFSNYIDKGNFNITQSYFDPVTNAYQYNNVQIPAALPIRQINLRVGVTF